MGQCIHDNSNDSWYFGGNFSLITWTHADQLIAIMCVYVMHIHVSRYRHFIKYCSWLSIYFVPSVVCWVITVFDKQTVIFSLYREAHAVASHDDVIKWKHFPRYWPFVRGIHRSPVNSPHKGQWRGALMFLMCVWINGCVNNREADDLRRNQAHYDVIVMRTHKISRVINDVTRVDACNIFVRKICWFCTPLNKWYLERLWVNDSLSTEV